jgi:AcrR family transcriptional regulator
MRRVAGTEVETPPRRRRGRPRLPADQQRRRLIDAAERVFENREYEGASVLEIVREAGMSTRSFYEFFGSKEDLVTALASARADAFLEQISSELGHADDVVAAIDQIVQVFLSSLPVVVVDLEGLGGAAGQRVREVRKRYREAIGALLLEELVRLSERGLIKSPPEPMSLAIVLAGIEGIVISFHNEGRTREDLLALHPALLSALRELFSQLLG